MTDDASLSDFSATADEASDDATADSETSTATPATEPQDSAEPIDGAEPTAGVDDAEPTADGDGNGGTPATYAWGEYTCGRCDRSTDRVWRDDGAFVCPTCKRW